MPAEVGPCGPNGVLHSGPGGDPHCDCDPGFSVVDGTCVEAAPPPAADPMPVSTDPDCGSNGIFDGSSCRCDPGYTQVGLGELRTCAEIPACTSNDDAHEPNDLPGDAALLSEVDGLLYACPANPDWYIFPVTAGDRVSVLIQFDGARVDLDLVLYGPSSRNPRALSLEAAGNTEAAGFVVRADGTAGIYVVPYGTGQGGYELLVDVQSGEAPMCLGPGAFCSSSQDCCSNVCHIGHCH